MTKDEPTKEEPQGGLKTNEFGVTIRGYKEDFGSRWDWGEIVDHDALHALAHSIAKEAGKLVLNTIVDDMAVHLWSGKDRLTLEFSSFDGELGFSIELADVLEDVVHRGKLDPDDDEIDNVKYAISVLESAVTSLRNTLPED